MTYKGYSKACTQPTSSISFIRKLKLKRLPYVIIIIIFFRVKAIKEEMGFCALTFASRGV